MRQIDAAINDLRQAAYDDGKNPNDKPQVEEIIDPRGRLRAALDHLGRARALRSPARKTMPTQAACANRSIWSR